MRPYSNIEDVLEKIFFNEGVKNGKTGYYTKDGTNTNFGIAFEYNQEVLALHGIHNPDQMKNMGLGIAVQIYVSEYWDKCHAGLFKKDLAYQIFDAAVNQGVGASIRMMQKMHNIVRPDEPIDVDGGFGSQTSGAIDYIRKTTDSRTLCAIYRNLRKVRYYKNLFHRARKVPDNLEDILGDFEASWINRV